MKTPSHYFYRYKLWTDDDLKHRLDILKHCEEQLKSAATPVEKSDVWRLAVLFEMGGVYVDTDFEAFSSLDCLRQRYSLFAGISNTGTVEINNGLIGSVPKHPILQKCLESIKLSGRPPDSVNSMATNTVSRTGPGLFTRCFMEFVEADKKKLQSLEHPVGPRAKKKKTKKEKTMEDIIALPCGFLYPFPNHLRSMKSRRDRMIFLRPESLALHHWACSWQDNTEVKTPGGGAVSKQTKRNLIQDVVSILGPLENERTGSTERDLKESGKPTVGKLEKEKRNSNQGIPQEALKRIGFFLGLTAKR